MLVKGGPETNTMCSTRYSCSKFLFKDILTLKIFIRGYIDIESIDIFYVQVTKVEEKKAEYKIS